MARVLARGDKLDRAAGLVLTGTDPETYALSEVAEPTVAAHIAAWSQIPFTGLRFVPQHSWREHVTPGSS